jgi:ATP-dependent Lhr-like helicase
VVFRDLVARESNIPKWSALLRMLRRLEDRGEIRGGRFVTGFGGEQFALPEAVESLRAWRHRRAEETITVAAADPMNLAGIVIPGERVAAVPGRSLTYCDGQIAGNQGDDSQPYAPRAQRRRPVTHEPAPVRIGEPAAALRLF